MNKDNRILIIYPYFDPARKAGGIVRSLSHLVSNLSHFSFDVLTSCYDLDGTHLPVETDSWVTHSPNCRVWYCKATPLKQLRKIFCDSGYRTIYINGVYGWRYFLYPLVVLKSVSRQDQKIIVAPRGMLQEGALRVKSLKKKIYFTILKAIGLLGKVRWHATDAQELKDIQLFLGKKKGDVVYAIDSPPLKPLYGDIIKTKEKGQLRMVFLSLITEKKNLMFLLNMLDQHPDLSVQLDVYGPVKDYGYWELCQPIISKNQTKIRYKGEVNPSDVSNILKSYDLLVLPTLGENFGHVIFEALAAGTPVLISPFTPWHQLEKKDCGAVLALDEDIWLSMLQRYVDMDHDQHHAQCVNAQRYIKDFLLTFNFKEEYTKLFFDLAN